MNARQIDGEAAEIYLTNHLLPSTTPAGSAELGALMAAVGLSVSEARGYIERIQALSANTALAAAPQLLEQIRDVQQSRLQTLYLQLSTLPQYRVAGMVVVPYISRDRVLELVQQMMMNRPKL